MKVDDLYLRGLIACFTSPTVPPEVLIAAARLLAQIDHGSVDMALDGARAVLSYAGDLLAELTEQVPGVSVRVVVSLGVGSPSEMLITRDPIGPGLIALCRMEIAREDALDGRTVDRRIESPAKGKAKVINGGQRFTSADVGATSMIERVGAFVDALARLGAQPSSVVIPAEDLTAMRMAYEGTTGEGPSVYDVAIERAPWLAMAMTDGAQRRRWVFAGGLFDTVVEFQ